MGDRCDDEQAIERALFSPRGYDLRLVVACGRVVGVDLLPADMGARVVLEVNGAVDFKSSYSPTDDVFAVARSALGGVVVEPAAGLAS